jgi:hypothetical protein
MKVHLILKRRQIVSLKAVLKIIGLSRRLEPGILVLAWGVFIAALALAQIFQGHLIPQRYYGGAMSQFFSEETIFYLEVLAVSVLAGLVINDPPRAILSFFHCQPSSAAPSQYLSSMQP